MFKQTLQKKLTFGTVVLVEIFLGSITARANGVIGYVAGFTAVNRLDIDTVSFFDVRYVIIVMPYFVFNDARRLIDFEFLIFGRMRIIKSKLPERNKFADKFKKK